jgi:hypothetical protein
MLLNELSKPSKPYSVNDVNDVNSVNEDDKRQQTSTGVNECQHVNAPKKNSFQGNLAVEIQEWVEESRGSFTVAEIDREFGLTSRKDKQRRSTILRRLKDKDIIIKDRRRAGVWHIVNAQIDFIDLEAVDEAPFKLSLPLGLSQIVTIPPKGIVCLAGSPNSGKTCLALNILRANMGEHSLLYLMSEMGSSEYKQRIQAFGDELTVWNRDIKAASLSSGFDGAIKHHNPHGITVVDFLEEIDGEYYRIASDIRAIYDALGDGVAVVMLQKNTNALYGRGGQATSEKARLYLTLDTLLHRPGFTISSLRIGKAKAYPGANPNGRERHFKIIRGHRIEPVSDWMYCNEKQRAAWITAYQNDERYRS